jgi:hypothetical protein
MERLLTFAGRKPDGLPALTRAGEPGGTARLRAAVNRNMLSPYLPQAFFEMIAEDISRQARSGAAIQSKEVFYA